MAKITLVSGGVSRWNIVCPSRGQPGVDFAVEELRSTIEAMSRCRLPVREEPAAGGTLVMGLRDDLSPDDRRCLPAPAEGHDGYELCIGPGGGRRVVLAGANGRGLIYGVYDLLERMGCRFYYPRHDEDDPEVLPRTSTIRVECAAHAMATPLLYRIYNGSHWFFQIDRTTAVAEIDHAMKCRYNGMGWQCLQDRPPLDQYADIASQGVMDELRKRDMFLHGPAHSFSLFLPNEHFESHPEWFGFRDGARRPQVFGGSQFCWSNADARKVFADNVEQFVLAVPELKILCTLGFDGGKCCECPRCLESTPANLVVQLMNELAERLRDRAPHVIVETSGGYAPVHDPPERPPADPALRIVWAHWGRNHQAGYDDPCYGWEDNLNRWRTFVDGRLTLCQYYADTFASPWIAAPYAIAMESDRRYLLQHEIDGWYMLIWPRGTWWNAGLNVYLGGVCFYDATRSPSEEIRDYARRYFGPKAGPYMAAYYEQWAREPRLPHRVKDNAEDYDRAVFAAQRKCWIDPATRATRQDPVHAYRVGKAAKLHAFAERAAEMWRQQQEITKLRAQGRFERASEKLAEARVFTDDLLAYLHELADLNQGLVDKKEIPGFTRLKIKQWIDEEAEAVSARRRTGEPPAAGEASSMDTVPAEVLEQQQADV